MFPALSNGENTSSCPFISLNCPFLFQNIKTSFLSRLHIFMSYFKGSLYPDLLSEIPKIYYPEIKLL